MGGYGTFSLALFNPRLFAAIIPICGGGKSVNAVEIKHVPTWVFHGLKDNIVPVNESRRMVDALERIGGNVKFTIYPEAEHDSWTETYNNMDIYLWLLQHKLESLKS